MKVFEARAADFCGVHGPADVEKSKGDHSGC